MKLKSLMSIVAGAAMALSAGVLAASPAHAVGRDGNCESGEFCYYYNTGPAGSVSDFTASVADYGTTPSTCYAFKGAGAGQGKCIKNNAAAVWNKSSQTVRVYYNSNFNNNSAGGIYLDIAPGLQVNLSGTRLYNQNASHQFIGAATHDPLPDPRDPPTPPAAAKWASPVPAGTVMTAHFGTYPSGGAHSGTDYSGFGGKFKSACAGTVSKIAVNATYANRNAYKLTGSTNYLWIDCGGGITMGYAHWYANTRPAWITVGAPVSAGQELIAVGNQGNSSATHVHFEVRRNGVAIDGHDFLVSMGVQGLPKKLVY
jgi:murein DD-endopeptidase MepM/ murein hydrolase activator NlpD